MPEELSETMRRIWRDVAPTSDRIVEDILGFCTVLKTIIEHNGCIVPDQNFRRGRRAYRVDGKGKMARNPQIGRRLQDGRKLIIHPDLVDAVANIEVKAFQELHAIFGGEEAVVDVDIWDDESEEGDGSEEDESGVEENEVNAEND